MTEEQSKRKLTAILSADVKGYSRLMEDDEEATVRTITAYREVMVSQIQDQNGRVVDAKGDNILAEFASVVDAVRCAVEIQKELGKRNAELLEHRKMEFRIGVNLGDVIEEKETIYGDGVNIAARLEALADGGGICVSGTAFDHIGKRLSVGYEYLGEQTVKNIEKRVRVYRVLMEPEAAGKVIGEKRATLRQWRWAALAAVVTIILVAGALTIRHFYFRRPFEPASVERMAFPLPDKPSVAVLPFANMSGDTEQEYFSDGITEDLITDLSKISGLFVIARNSVFTYKGKAVKVEEVGQELGVKYVLQGSVRKARNRVRITAQLVDATTGGHLWAERYDRDLRDIFALQDEVTQKIVTALVVKLTEDEQERLLRKGTDNLEAYDYALRGMDYFFRFTKEANGQARQMFEKAIDLDPKYALGHAWLGWTHWVDYSFGWSQDPQSLEGAFELAQRAISLDDAVSEGHALLGKVHLWKRRHDLAIAELEKTLSLNPNYADGLTGLGEALYFAGRPEEAIGLVKRAMRLNPKYPVWYLLNLGHAYFLTGSYEEAITTLKRVINRNPNVWPAYIYLAASYVELGQQEQARIEASEVLRINPNFSLEVGRQRLPYKDKAVLARLFDILQKAGLPETPPLPLPDKPSIAVLPFVNMSGDPEQEYFSDGITEEIITALSKTPKLFVIARNSTFTYKGKPVKVQHVGRELGVKHVLEGSVRKAEDRVRITAQLVDARTGNHLWAERYDRDLKGVFAIQDEITLEIIKAMQVQLTMGETARVTGKGTKNLDAYLRALHAQEEWFRMDKEGSIKARQLAMEAIALDPQYGYPYAIVAWCHMLDVVRQYSQSPKESMRLAVEAIQKALALDVSDHRIHRVLSNLYVMQGKHDDAIASSKRALELCPGGALSYETLGVALLFACRPSQAIPMLEKAIELDPFPPAVCHRNLAMAYQHVGRYEDAIVEGRKAFRINPNDLSTPISLVFAYAKLGRNEEARAAAAEVLRINPEFTLDSLSEIRARMFAEKCHSDRVYDDVEFIRKADVGLK